MSEQLERYKDNIQKTGFLLEYKISLYLQKNKWNIINNRYYIDDSTNDAREIDILAYKVNIIKNVRYYTTLLISSKKSEENDWAFLTKSLNQKDPNLDYFPVVNWTNEEYLKYMLETSDWKKRLIKDVLENAKLNKVHKIDEHLFAFQEMSKNSGKVQNDKKIYLSISSLVKSLSYEVISLDRRVDHNSFYSFYLLSVVDADLINIHFNESEISCKFIDEIMYLNRFIVNGKDDFHRVHFIKYDALENAIESYNELHNWNANFFSKLHQEFFKNLIGDSKKVNFQLKKYQSSMKYDLNRLLQEKYHGGYTLDDFILMQVYEGSSAEKLRIYISADENLVTFLNDSREVGLLFKRLLARNFNYKGSFYFSTDDLPF